LIKKLKVDFKSANRKAFIGRNKTVSPWRFAWNVHVDSWKGRPSESYALINVFIETLRSEFNVNPINHRFESMW